MEDLMRELRQIFRSLTDGLRTKSISILPSPLSVRKKYSLSRAEEKQILSWRQSIVNILNRQDNRFLAILGPCSVHDEKTALAYFRWVKSLADRFGDKIFIVGRACFEKPRTRNGWEGYLSDYSGDGHCDLKQGFYHCRHFLAETVKIGLPIALESLDQNSEQYFSDLLSFIWIGARTTEAQTLRRMVSAMSCPVGIKNATSGDVTAAIDAMVYAQSEKTFPGLNLYGQLATMKSKGNFDTFLVLRGGKRPDYFKRERDELFKIFEEARAGKAAIEKVSELFKGDIRPNYTPKEIAEAVKVMKKEGILPKIIVDCSHGNSRKDHLKQIEVWKNIVEQRKTGNLAIRGGMLESYVKSGNQKYSGSLKKLDPEISITDACIGEKETEELLSWTYERL